MTASGNSEKNNRYKKYISAHEAGRLFGYSSNCIRRLVREQKIFGAQISHQWFVDPESLGAFVLSVSKQKAIQSEAIKEARKVERKYQRILSGDAVSFSDRAKLVSDRSAQFGLQNWHLHTIFFSTRYLSFRGSSCLSPPHPPSHSCPHPPLHRPLYHPRHRIPRHRLSH